MHRDYTCTNLFLHWTFPSKSDCLTLYHLGLGQFNPTKWAYRTHPSSDISFTWIIPQNPHYNKYWVIEQLMSDQTLKIRTTKGSITRPYALTVPLVAHWHNPSYKISTLRTSKNLKSWIWVMKTQQETELIWPSGQSQQEWKYGWMETFQIM